MLVNFVKIYINKYTDYEVHEIIPAKNKVYVASCNMSGNNSVSFDVHGYTSCDNNVRPLLHQQV